MVIAYTLDILVTNTGQLRGLERTMALKSEILGGFESVCAASGNGTTCRRCGGLMVGEFCMDLPNGTGELEFLASRCVQCGDVVDPVILKNRRLRRPSSISQLPNARGQTPNKSIQ